MSSWGFTASRRVVTAANDGEAAASCEVGGAVTGLVAVSSG